MLFNRRIYTIRIHLRFFTPDIFIFFTEYKVKKKND